MYIIIIAPRYSKFWLGSSDPKFLGGPSSCYKGGRLIYPAGMDAIINACSAEHNTVKVPQMLDTEPDSTDLGGRNYKTWTFPLLRHPGQILYVGYRRIDTLALPAFSISFIAWRALNYDLDHISSNTTGRFNELHEIHIT